MPALPFVPKAIRFVERYALTGVARPIINSFHMGYNTGDITAGDILTLANLWASTWATDLSPIFATALTLEDVTATSLSSATAPTVTVASGATGSTTGAPVPAGVSLVEQRHIARRYRGGHSRVYRAGVGESQLLNPDEWNPTYVAAAESAMGAFQLAVELGAPSGYGGFFHSNISYFQGFHPFLYPSGRYRNIPTLRTTPLVDPLLGADTINPKPASQRRRNGQSS